MSASAARCLVCRNCAAEAPLRALSVDTQGKSAEIAKLVGKIGTKALIGVIVLVVVGLLIRAGVSKWRGARQARLAG